jgi:preprotein translocase subunit SecG
MPEFGVQSLTAMALMTGFGCLFVVLGCALEHNWWSLFSLFIFVFSGVPLALCGISSSNEGDAFDGGQTETVLTETSHFLTAFFYVSGVSLTFILRHADVIQFSTLVWTLMGFMTLTMTVLFYFYQSKSHGDPVLA